MSQRKQAKEKVSHKTNVGKVVEKNIYLLVHLLLLGQGLQQLPQVLTSWGGVACPALELLGDVVVFLTFFSSLHKPL